ncbi:MAG TPA: VTT domain-containing protein [Verrucomicrobiae bacterium]|nr:VTT domain-containing protein [Verrucomicrobiae bacterium]
MSLPLKVTGRFSMAFWSSMAGSLLGSLSFYGLGLALGEARSFAALKRSSKLLGISEAQLGRLILSFRRHERALVFTSQLIPSVRLVAPGIAGLLRANFREFLIATTSGVVLWNALFIGVGYAAAILDNGANASAVAMRSYGREGDERVDRSCKTGIGPSLSPGLSNFQ